MSTEENESRKKLARVFLEKYSWNANRSKVISLFGRLLRELPEPLLSKMAKDIKTRRYVPYPENEIDKEHEGDHELKSREDNIVEAQNDTIEELLGSPIKNGSKKKKSNVNPEASKPKVQPKSGESLASPFSSVNPPTPLSSTKGSSKKKHTKEDETMLDFDINDDSRDIPQSSQPQKRSHEGDKGISKKQKKSNQEEEDIDPDFDSDVSGEWDPLNDQTKKKKKTSPKPSPKSLKSSPNKTLLDLISPKKRKPKWSEAETRNLENGMSRKLSYREILDIYEFDNRTEADLRAKWHNMLKEKRK